MLAISLHAVRDELRDELVPINKKYPIAELMDACRNYPGVSNAKRITFEYVMLKGVNDSIADAKALVRLLAGIPAKINLIPFNPWPGSRYECSDWETIERFAEVVNKAGYASPVRTPRGRDILAACGQLRSRKREAARARAGGGAPHPLQPTAEPRAPHVLRRRSDAFSSCRSGFCIALAVAGFVLVTLGLEKITHAMHGQEAGAEIVESDVRPRSGRDRCSPRAPPSCRRLRWSSSARWPASARGSTT